MISRYFLTDCLRQQVITLNNPAQLNPMGLDMLQGFHSALKKVEDPESGIRCATFATFAHFLPPLSYFLLTFCSYSPLRTFAYDLLTVCPLLLCHDRPRHHGRGPRVLLRSQPHRRRWRRRRPAAGLLHARRALLRPRPGGHVQPDDRPASRSPLPGHCRSQRPVCWCDLPPGAPKTQRFSKLEL